MKRSFVPRHSASPDIASRGRDAAAPCAARLQSLARHEEARRWAARATSQSHATYVGSGAGPLTRPCRLLPTASSMLSQQTFGHFSCGGGVYATDGSGGSNTFDPRFRRCAWSVALVGEQDELLGAAWGSLPGKQTVGRAELWALLFLIILLQATL